LAFLIVLQFLLPHRAVASSFRLLGMGFIAIGVGLVIWVRILLGRNQAMGERFFFPETFRRASSGPFKLLRNPMYDGFILVFAGLALAFGIYEDFILATTSFVLLNLWLSRIENFGL
jgi:protein-S-isoprenylcysteine O-methyltransferase Ste14